MHHLVAALQHAGFNTSWQRSCQLPAARKLHPALIHHSTDCYSCRVCMHQSADTLQDSDPDCTLTKVQQLIIAVLKHRALITLLITFMHLLCKQMQASELIGNAACQLPATRGPHPALLHHSPVC
jgi:hypothetical protein